MFRSQRRNRPVESTDAAATFGTPRSLEPTSELLGSDLFRPAPPNARPLPTGDGLFHDVSDEEHLPVDDTSGLFVPFEEAPRVELSEEDANDPFACFDLPAPIDPDSDLAGIRTGQIVLPRWRGRLQSHA